MQGRTTEIEYFFYSQAFADGFRATLAILLPALAGFYFNHFETGLTISIGAMCANLSDAPGPIIHKKNGLLFCAFFSFLVAFLTPYARLNPYTMGLEIATVTFFFSMFMVYGNRAGSVGNAAILVMILTMDEPISTHAALLYAVLIFTGAMFYMAISLMLYTIRPYRNAQRALGDCLREIATYLSIRADFYDVTTDLEEGYRKLVAQQIVVNEKQDAIRELFFKTRQIVRESTDISRRLIFTFVETVDLFEDITASYYDYASLRKEFGQTGALKIIELSLRKIVFEIYAVGLAIQTNTSFQKSFDYDAEIKNLKSQIDQVTKDQPANNIILRKIIVNLRKLLADLSNIQQYFKSGSHTRKSGVDHSHFITHQSLDPRILWNNLSIDASVFRHALRVCLACSVGFIIARALAYGHHSYWIIMTIAFMLKPAFSLTRQRNKERVLGTLVGGAIGIGVLVFIPDKTLQFVIMVLFMLGTYSFVRINYLVMVICTTPYILILFSLLGAGYKDVVQERMLDTVLGCTIAFLASYLFPRWESDQLKNHMQQILKANAGYMEKIVEALGGHTISMLEYKLARKSVYLHSANLSAAFQRMLSEPRRKQGSKTRIHQFVVLNHILFSNIATIATTLLGREARPYSPQLVQLARNAYVKLEESCRKMGGGSGLPSLKIHDTPAQAPMESADDVLMQEQLNFIYRVSTDIDKLTDSLNDAETRSGPVHIPLSPDQ
ncbi:MAG: FUSC family membrane protein [Flavisolibacter sp.]